MNKNDALLKKKKTPQLTNIFRRENKRENKRSTDKNKYTDTRRCDEDDDNTRGVKTKRITQRLISGVCFLEPVKRISDSAPSCL